MTWIIVIINCWGGFVSLVYKRKKNNGLEKNWFMSGTGLLSASCHYECPDDSLDSSLSRWVLMLLSLDCLEWLGLEMTIVILTHSSAQTLARTSFMKDWVLDPSNIHKLAVGPVAPGRARMCKHGEIVTHSPILSWVYGSMYRFAVLQCNVSKRGSIFHVII